MGMRAQALVAGLVASVIIAALSIAASAGQLQRPPDPAPRLDVWKGSREMWLRYGDRVTRKFLVSLGSQPMAPKLRRGDGRTPVGKYYVVEKRPRSRFRRFLGLNYPNVDDAERGFAARIISAEQWADILFANLRKDVPPWVTALGGRVGIHGQGGRRPIGPDWTEGCIAVSDDDIEYLFHVIPIGTPVTIHD